MAHRLAVQGVDKYFGDFQALSDVSFAIDPGKFVTLLGPSGCGKTTLLRIIAGFLQPENGQVLFGSRVMNTVPPNKRNTAMCFQSYALFPHKTVYENVSFGLRMHKVPLAQQRERVMEALEMVDLTGLEGRKPYALSGGQQQRVALARAVVVRPDILLFDEPLSNLDAKLREKVRMDIRNIQHSLGITTVYVTHDQAEALAISDVIIAMNKGRIIQVSNPRSIYNEPKTKFVADFIGNANIVKGQCIHVGPNDATMRCPYGDITLTASNLAVDSEYYLCIRPEDLRIVSGEQVETDENILEGRLRYAVYMGSSLELFAEINGQVIRASVMKNYRIEEGAPVRFAVARGNVTLMEG